jgi:mannose/fructose-specific phosphotransferase system component IIA
MSEAIAARGLILSHGSLAEGFVDAVRQITGVGEDVLIGLSNQGLSPDALGAEVRRLVEGEPTVLFTDLPSGSCCVTALRLHREGLGIVVVSGINLPLLLYFVLHRDLPLAELGVRLVEKGRAAISVAQSDST